MLHIYHFHIYFHSPPNTHISTVWTMCSSSKNNYKYEPHARTKECILCDDQSKALQQQNFMWQWMSCAAIRSRTIIIDMIPPIAVPLAYAPYLDALMYLHLLKQSLDICERKIAMTPKIGFMNTENMAIPKLSAGLFSGFGAF